MPVEQKRPDLDTGMLRFGLIFGFVIGGLVTLLTAPKNKKSRETLASLAKQARNKIEDAVPTDPVEDSLAVGKAAAKRRRDTLGLSEQAQDEPSEVR